MTAGDAKRMCAGCGEKLDRDALLRLVLAGDPPQVVPDVRRQASGRGVSVHPTYRCLDAAVRRGRVAAGLRTRSKATAPELAGWARSQYTRRAEGLIGAAVRSGQVALGVERTREAVAEGSAWLVVVAPESSEARRGPRAGAEAEGPPRVSLPEGAHLGASCGRAELSALAILSRPIARQIERAIRAEADLAEGT